MSAATSPTPAAVTADADPDSDPEAPIGSDIESSVPVHTQPKGDKLPVDPLTDNRCSQLGSEEPLEGTYEEDILSAAKESPAKLPREDLRRDIVTFITCKWEEVEENRVVTVREDRYLRIAEACFDYKFEEAPGQPPYLLGNISILDGVDLDRLDTYKAYDDPENPPVHHLNVDGTTSKLLGEFTVKWGPRDGPLQEYDRQQIFLNPYKFLTSRCLLLPRKSPFQVLVGVGTIREHGLEEPLALVAGHKGQGGKHSGKPPVNHVAVMDRQAELETQRADQARTQNRMEKKEEHERRKTKKPQSTKTK